MPIALGAEDNVPAIGRVAALGVIAVGFGEPFQAGSIRIGLENVHVSIEVPLVATAAAGLAVFFALNILRVLQLFGIWVTVTAGINDLFAIGRKVWAGGASHARADAAVLSAREIEYEYLIERIASV